MGIWEMTRTNISIMYVCVTVARLVTAGQTASLECVSPCQPTTLCLDNVISNCVTQASASAGDTFHFIFLFASVSIF